MSDLRKGLTPKEAAEKFGYCAAHIRHLIRKGELKAERIGQSYLIDPESFREYWHRKGRATPKRLKGQM